MDLSVRNEVVIKDFNISDYLDSLSSKILNSELFLCSGVANEDSFIDS